MSPPKIMSSAWELTVVETAMPVWLEWVSIVCGIMSIGMAGIAPVASVSAVASKSSVAAVAKIGSGLPGNRPGNPGFAVETAGNFGNHAPSSVTVASDQARVLEALKKMGGEARSQDDLAQWIVVGETRGVSKGEMSKMLKSCPQIERVRVDNRHVIRIREPV